ncbi:saccharopine dehydrogenase Lys3 [Saitoella complicata NRRL Y-17804]|nr:saccharopine dehydrogenase Lys3 [Saitoella complicata NRRL Y-17804]ODQ55826.1 saccharopine dehydrogenase Lys3 [Saitoella complicata NRRL Y-17804]
MSAPHLWLRAESKAMEHRSALTPTTAKALIDAGFKITIERSTLRIFDDAEFDNIGAPLVEEGSWRDAPKDAYIIALKELPENDDTPLPHDHIMFAHCYKQQGGWKDVLARWPRGGGVLLDLEFLQDESGRRVAAFGFHAGFAGAALAIESWAWQQTHSPEKPLPAVTPYPNEGELISHIKEVVAEGVEKNGGEYPRILVIGALGRCGSGAVDMARKAGIPEENIIKWDMAETAKGGPFQEIVDSDIFVNCIYLSQPIPPFISPKFMENKDRKLQVICDVSCDTTNPHNPIPVYSINTTFDKPTVPVDIKTGPHCTVISIDHLPTLLPRESSEAFSSALLPSLLQLKDRKNARVWQDAEKLFNEKVATL